MQNTDNQIIRLILSPKPGVILAKAGIQKLKLLLEWIPVFTGMTAIAIVVLFFTFSPAFTAGIAENFLSHGPSVASYGRGETATSIFEDNSSVFYNPSLLAEANSNGVVLAEHTLFDGSSYSYAGFNGLLNKAQGSFSASAINLRSGDVELRTEHQ